MRHRVTATVQEFCPVFFLPSKNKRHQSAASRSQSYCSRLHSNFTRVNWPSLKQWARIQWKNTEGSVWNDWLTHCIKMQFFSITSKWKTKNFHGKVKIKWLIFISPSSQLFLGNWSLSFKYLNFNESANSSFTGFRSFWLAVITLYYFVKTGGIRNWREG